MENLFGIKDDLIRIGQLEILENNIAKHLCTYTFSQ